MNRISPYLLPGASIADAQRMLDEHPSVRDYLAGLGTDRANKSRARASIAKAFGDDVALLLVPRGRVGRPSREPSAFDLLSAPARQAIADALGVPDMDGVEWTPESASAAADALVNKYASNTSSAAIALKNLRHGLFARVGVAPADARANPIIAATYREAITSAHNAKAAPRLEARAAAGVDVPEAYARLADLIERARAFVASPEATPMAAADLLVILSARPGEAETIAIGDRGGLTGVLKKRGKDPAVQYNLVSAVGPQLAEAYLDAWRALPLGAKRGAMTGLARLAASWGLQRRDLRAVGAALAVRAEALEGRAGNVSAARAVHAQALRHEPTRATAQQHYERVNDRVSQLAAQLAELSDSELAAIRALIPTRP